jgi:hypothetical protein
VDKSVTGSANFFGPNWNTTALEAVLGVGGERPRSPDTREVKEV